MNQQLWNEVPTRLLAKKSKTKTTSKRTAGKKGYFPKDEMAFCNFVAGYLNNQFKTRGIIINREVTIRTNPGAKGERTDMLIDAVAVPDQAATYEHVTVVIEAKGIWNDDLHISMETQLAKQYLHEAESKSGIYLVGYFNCSQWHSSDAQRLRKAKKRNLEETRPLLEQQSRDLSKNGLSIKAVILDASLRELPSSLK